MNKYYLEVIHDTKYNKYKTRNNNLKLQYNLQADNYIVNIINIKQNIII
jgi:hypothetical protein